MPLERSLLEKIPLSAEALPLILPLPSPLPPLVTPPRHVTLRKRHLKVNLRCQTLSFGVEF